MQLQQLIEIFELTVGDTHRTRLQGGAPEPFYRPGLASDELSVIYFRDNYSSSALHEIAHWCIAGPERRLQEDYGYWYKGDRGFREQREFEVVEARPQALEWIMSEAAGIPFRVSCDNFDESTLDLPGFRRVVKAHVPQLLDRMPVRAARFIDGLVMASGCYGAFQSDRYEELPN